MIFHSFHGVLKSHVSLLLLVLIVTMYWISGCVADSAPKHHCMFDEIMRRSGGLLQTAVVREVPRKGQGAMRAYTVGVSGDNVSNNGSEWSPIRIIASTVDLENSEKHCSSVGVSRPDFEGGSKECSGNTQLTEERKNVLLNTVMPLAIKLHAERLLVQRVKSKWIVPQFNEAYGNCQYFTVPASHGSEGVQDADMVLYVASGAGTKTWAIPCATLSVGGRPVAGVMHVYADHIASVRAASRILAHEIAHALGFDLQEMEKKKILLNITAVRGESKAVMVVNSVATLEKAKRHFGCDTIKGMELQTRIDGVVESHWSERNAKDELMSNYKDYTLGYYTALTMALFEDLGYYRAVWGMEEPMSWGNKVGCNFLDNPCPATTSDTKYPGMFCNRADYSLRCTSDRYAVGRCFDIVGNRLRTPQEICPVAVPETRAKRSNLLAYATCTETEVQAQPGSLAASNSWCLDAESLQAKSTEGGNSGYTPVRGVCAKVSCEDDKVKVMYLGGSEWHECPEGKSITPTSSEFKGEGKIICPKYEEVCTIGVNGSSIIKPRSSPNGNDAGRFVSVNTKTNVDSHGSSTTPGSPDDGKNDVGGANANSKKNGGRNGSGKKDGTVIAARLEPLILPLIIFAVLALVSP